MTDPTITQGYLRRLQDECFGPFLSAKSLRLLKKRCPICAKRFKQGNHESCREVLDRFLACKDGRLADPDLRAMILSRDGYRCRYCERRIRFDNAHIDHLIPWSKGGRTVPQNLVSSCRSCNMAKQAIIPARRDLECMIFLGQPLRERAEALGYRTRRSP